MYVYSQLTSAVKLKYKNSAGRLVSFNLSPQNLMKQETTKRNEMSYNFRVTRCCLFKLNLSHTPCFALLFIPDKRRGI